MMLHEERLGQMCACSERLSSMSWAT